MIRPGIAALALVGMFIANALEPSETCAQRLKDGKGPNFLVIVADDLGFSDLGCYGGEIETPNLDALAAGGLKYSCFYNTARCWPTRAAILTGYYPQQVRRDSMPGFIEGYGGGGKRPQWASLVPATLKQRGYRSYHSGKWHLDGDPLKNGFDQSDQVSRGPGFFESIRREHRDPKFFQTTAIADHAIECLKEHASRFSEQPFFHYLAFYAPHFPLQAQPVDIQKYSGRYAEGWDQLRRERFNRQSDLGLQLTLFSEAQRSIGPPYAFPDQLEILGAGEVTLPLEWRTLDAEQRAFQAAKMEIHAAMVDRMDQDIGRVLAQIRSMGAMENTFICFLSDNGASAELMVRGDGHDPSAPLGSASTYLCLGPGYSSAANTPFRRHKTWVHEGGISTPLIVHWPEGIEDSGQMRGNLAHVIDLAPTIFDLADVDPIAAQRRPPLPGTSLVPSFAAPKTDLHDELWFFHEGNRALRTRDWKIVHADSGRPFPWTRSDAARNEGKSPSQWALYDMRNDRAESKDLSGTHSSLVQEMENRWWQIRDQFSRDSQGD